MKSKIKILYIIFMILAPTSIVLDIVQWIATGQDKVSGIFGYLCAMIFASLYYITSTKNRSCGPYDKD